MFFMLFSLSICPRNDDKGGRIFTMVDVKRIENIRVVGVQKRKEHSSKHYEFILKVQWYKRPEVTIYRPYSMFFDFQGVLCHMFQDKSKVTIPSVPVAKFHWVLLGKLGIEKECKAIEDFCQKIIGLPPTISESSAVLHFFEAWGTDLRISSQHGLELLQDVGSPVIQSQDTPGNHSPETIHTGPSGVSENQYRAIASYDASNDGEVRLAEGEVLTVVEKTDRGWWFVCNEKGSQGWAPATYLETLSEEDEGGLEDLIPLKEGEVYVTVSEYSAQNSDEVSYDVGEQVEVLAKSNYGWWKIKHKGKVGLTPATNLCRKGSLQSSQPVEFGRTLSISSNSGLYAVIRKPPPRRDTVKKSKKSGKKPSRLVYSTASFSGGKFSFDDNGNRTFQGSEDAQPRKSGSDDERVQPQSYENVEIPSPRAGRQPRHSVDVDSSRYEDDIGRSLLLARGSLPDLTASCDGRMLNHTYMNRSALLNPGVSEGPEYYRAIADYVPGSNRPEDIILRQGDVVQLISVDGNWLFVMLKKSGDERQGWVPATYVERRTDLSSERMDKGDDRPKPKPRPHVRRRGSEDIIDKPPSPAPRVHRTSEDRSGSPTVIPVPQPRSKRPSLPYQLESDLEALRTEHRPAAPPPSTTERRKLSTPSMVNTNDNIYDEPASPQLRSVYDAEPWFFGKISRQDCEQLLKTHGRQQEFLVRESQRGSGSYALSVKYCYRIRHFPIETSLEGKLVIGKLNFKNLMDLVSYYQDNPLFYSEHKEPITLGHPFEKK